MSAEIGKLLANLVGSADAIVAPPRGVPVPAAPDGLPLDLRRFFELCGGVSLFPDSDYPARIVGPDELVQTNCLLLPGQEEEALHVPSMERSWHWYSVVSDEKGDYISIDLSPRRLGQCYDSARDTYAIRGQSPIIATTFTDLPKRLVANRGEYWYWLRSEFVGMGDAYD